MARDRSSDGSPDGSPTKTSTQQHRIRQRSPLVTAVLSGGICLLLLAALAGRWSDRPQPLFAAWLVFALAALWSLFIRPAVILDDEGVTIRNIVRDVHIPWQHVTDAESRWNLKVFVGDNGYTAWAISSQVERPRLRGGMAGMMTPGRSGADSNRTSAAPKVTAAAVAREIKRLKNEHAAAHGALSAASQTPVRVTWAPLAIAAMALPAIAVIALSLI